MQMIPKLFYKKADGGPNSGVTGYFLIEWKPFFSIGLLHFSKGSREAYHNHAFNAITFWLWGWVLEEYTDKQKFLWAPSIIPKYTPRNCYHKVIGLKETWALTFRGPWKDTWNELRPDREVTLTHGRKEI